MEKVYKVPSTLHDYRPTTRHAIVKFQPMKGNEKTLKLLGAEKGISESEWHQTFPKISNT